MSFSKNSLRKLPKGPGVYLFKNAQGEPIYVGKSADVRARVRSHLASSGPKAQAIIEEASRVEAIPVNYELEALLLEAKLIKRYLPKFNSRAKDDKHPLYIKITTEDLPQVTTSRLEDKNALYFGPFASSQTVREVLREIRKVFPFHSQKKGGKRACFYSHLGLCNPCPNEISKIKDKKLKRELEQKYKRNIKNIIRLLSGKANSLKREFRKQMEDASKKEEFEEAARVRDQLRRLEYITAPYRPATAYLENPNLLADIREKEMEKLSEVLKKQLKVHIFPRRIECFDVSHLYGASPTASMVTFLDGEPQKNFYRHFKIRSKKRMDDMASISEVLARRIHHFEDWGKPDLIIVDGGKPQISAAVRVLQEKEVDIPLVGLAKRHEELVFLQENADLNAKIFKRIRLAKSSPALHLVQRIRDEAHRFARAYHLKLRLREVHT